jgi:hypothetical protein
MRGGSKINKWWALRIERKRKSKQRYITRIKVDK